jgi:hypothetical protein
MAEEQKSKVSRTNIIHGVVYSLLIVALFGLAYLNFIDTQSVTKPTPTTSQCNSFESLTDDVKILYVKRSEYKQLEDSYIKLETEFSDHSDESSEVEATQDHKSIATADMQSDSVVKVKDFAQCYKMDNASYKVSPSCRKTITDYVDKHKDAKYFEIIGIVDNLEFNLFNNLESHQALYRTLRINQKIIDKMKKLTRRGLSKERASEVSWVIKTHTNMKAATYNANYELVSKKGQRGVIVRAYK